MFRLENMPAPHLVIRLVRRLVKVAVLDQHRLQEAPGRQELHRHE